MKHTRHHMSYNQYMPPIVTPPPPVEFLGSWILAQFSFMACSSSAAPSRRSLIAWRPRKKSYRSEAAIAGYIDVVNVIMINTSPFCRDPVKGSPHDLSGWEIGSKSEPIPSDRRNDFETVRGVWCSYGMIPRFSSGYGLALPHQNCFLWSKVLLEPPYQLDHECLGLPSSILGTSSANQCFKSK